MTARIARCLAGSAGRGTASGWSGDWRRTDFDPDVTLSLAASPRAHYSPRSSGWSPVEDHDTISGLRPACFRTRLNGADRGYVANPVAVSHFRLMTRHHRVGIIGGSGLYHIAGFAKQKWVKVKTPFGPPSDSFLTGHLTGRGVVFLPRHGRGHRILPSELNHRANIWAMKKLGVAWIISVSAVGSLQARYQPCDIVLPNQFVDRTKKSAEHTFFGRGIVAHIAFADPICEELRQLLLQTCRAFGARVHDGGAYVNMEGPAFSTRSESMTHHNLGYDVIGMTNLGEAKCAREAEIAYATMAMVTDYDSWKMDEAHVTVEMVIANLQRNAAQAKEIIQRVLPQLPSEPGCACHRALENAILTEKKLWPAKTKTALEPLLRKYV